MLFKQGSVEYCSYTPDVWECSLRELNRTVWSLYFCQNYRLWGNFVLCCRHQPQSCAPSFSPVPDSCSVAQVPNASTSLNFHLRETRTTPNLLSCPFSTRFTRRALFLSSPPRARLPPASGPAAGAGRARPGPAPPQPWRPGGSGPPASCASSSGRRESGTGPGGGSRCPTACLGLPTGSPPVPGRWRGRWAPPEARSRRGRRVAASGCGCWGRGWEAAGQGNVGGCALKPDFCVFFFFYLGVGARVTATHIPEVRLSLCLWHRGSV